MRDVAILGSGPSGLLCAWAVMQAGHYPHIISEGKKSHIPGSQHLHGPVPGLTSPYPEGTIQFIRLGTAEHYARKVYDDETRETGWDNYLQVYPSWNVLQAYDKLWSRFMGDVGLTFGRRTIERVDGKDAQRINEIINGHDLVISTIPAQALCWQNHEFRSTPYYIKQLPTPPADEAHELVVYNGLLSDAWYRWSILGGLCSIEYADRPHYFKDQPFIEGRKAISNNCDCWPTIQRCGRWAEWRHGVTMYKAYQKAVDLMEELS